MDGNRRFARKISKKSSHGHKKGAIKLLHVIQHCHLLGVKEITVYAFSMDNFNRPRDEVDDLFNMATSYFSHLLSNIKCHNGDIGIRVRILGRTDLLPQKVRDEIDAIEKLTSDKCNMYLNIALSYSAREEMASAIDLLGLGVSKNLIESSDIDHSLFEKCFKAGETFSHIDLLIRTSGEVRLSDFMLWQTQFSVIHFNNSLWPDFSLFDFMKAILDYQRECDVICREWIPNKKDAFVEDYATFTWMGKAIYQNNPSTTSNYLVPIDESSNSACDDTTGKELRIHNFLQYLKHHKLTKS